jgi:hypothetical protein
MSRRESLVGGEVVAEGVVEQAEKKRKQGVSHLTWQVWHSCDLASVALLGPGPLAPIQPPCLPLKPTVGTQTLAHPHPALIHAIISVIERFAWAYLQAAALPRWLRRSSPWRPFVCAWLRCIS